ncbi:U4/U6 snRNA-associated-splicing factor, putative [Hepatocystis sp. ex Piliocolobus tephrosceles]|nr:U4/U6 snRNA-associated-splicing factor, putative [Hepatocystis sp. ex Piliocolobus tephrosceles]
MSKLSDNKRRKTCEDDNNEKENKKLSCFNSPFFNNENVISQNENKSPLNSHLNKNGEEKKKEDAIEESEKEDKKKHQHYSNNYENKQKNKIKKNVFRNINNSELKAKGEKKQVKNDKKEMTNEKEHQSCVNINLTKNDINEGKVKKKNSLNSNSSHEENNSCKKNMNEQKNSKHFVIETTDNKDIILSNLKKLEENKLYVKNISDNITKDDIYDYFFKIQGYVDTRVVYDYQGKTKGFAYIEFDTKENATAFLNTLENSNDPIFKTFTLKNQNLYISLSNPKKNIYEEKKVFMKFIKCDDNIQDDTKLKEIIKNFFASHSIDVLDIRLLGEKENMYGYLELKNNEDVITCINHIKDCIINEGIHFSLHYCIPIIKKKKILDKEKIQIIKDKKKNEKEEKNKCTIVVQNLNFNTRKHKLQSLFEQIGEIDTIHLDKQFSKNNIKRNKGYAFVVFKHPDDATSSLILDQSIIDGRSITISKYSQNENTKKNNYSYMNNYYTNNHLSSNNYNYKYYKQKNNAYKQRLEKRRINLSTTNSSTRNDQTIQRETKGVDETKRVDETITETPAMTNDDFRKLLFN